MQSDDGAADAEGGMEVWRAMAATAVCARCGRRLGARGLSFFNDDVICPDCKAEEKRMPEYAATARQRCDEAMACLKLARRRRQQEAVTSAPAAVYPPAFRIIL